MNIVIRAYVKTPQRLALTRRTLESAWEKGLQQQGSLLVQNGAPQYQPALEGLCQVLGRGAIGLRFERDSDIKEGFVRALQLAEADQAPALICTDDIVFGRGTLEVLRALETRTLPELDRACNWGVVGLFACYPHPRSAQVTGDPGQVYELPARNFYGGVAIILNPKLARALMAEWEAVRAGRKDSPPCLEDIWINGAMTERGLTWHNTVRDYAWHTGNDARVVQANGSQYQTADFVGE